MKIVHIITRLIVGGAQENTLLSCEGQHDRGHEVTLITGPAIGPEGSLLVRAQTYGYRVIVLDSMHRAIRPWHDWRNRIEMTKLIRRLNPDIVHTHSSKAGIIGRRAAWKARGNASRPKIVHTIHGLAFTASTSKLINTVYKFLERDAARISDKIVCVADAMRDQSLAARIGTREQYVTVYSGMETKRFVDPPFDRSFVRARLGLAAEHVVVGTIARLFHLKGHDDLLAIAPTLCARFPDLRFLWIGDGLLRAGFERHIAEMNLKDRFILTGLVPPEQIPELAWAMDILVHPSRREGLARALPQGALARCPVITYDVDGNREGLIDDQSGYVIPPFDVERLHEALTKLLSDASLRERMAVAGREFALARFDTMVMIDRLDAVYQELLPSHNEPSA